MLARARTKPRVGAKTREATPIQARKTARNGLTLQEGGREGERELAQQAGSGELERARFKQALPEWPTQVPTPRYGLRITTL